MKIAFVLFATLLSASAFAADRCYVAQNPDSMKVEITPEDTSKSTVEGVAKADLKLYTNEGTRFADLNVTTKSGKKISVGAFYTSGDKAPAPGVRTYYVECDGGSMDVIKLENGKVVINSERIRGDIEGCDGIAEVILNDTEFLGVACRK
jgi:hypothetical protein